MSSDKPNPAFAAIRQSVLAEGLEHAHLLRPDQIPTSESWSELVSTNIDLLRRPAPAQSLEAQVRESDACRRREQAEQASLIRELIASQGRFTATMKGLIAALDANTAAHQAVLDDQDDGESWKGGGE